MRRSPKLSPLAKLVKSPARLRTLFSWYSGLREMSPSDRHKLAGTDAAKMAMLRELLVGWIGVASEQLGPDDSWLVAPGIRLLDEFFMARIPNAARTPAGKKILYETATYESEESVIASLLRLASSWAQSRSKDPNTRVGAVVYDPCTGSSFFGYNGFLPKAPDLQRIWDNRPTRPDGSPDDRDLEGKYANVVHAERNAIKKAVCALGENISRCYLVVTHYPCLPCVRDWICQFGIENVYVGSAYPEDAAAAAFAASHGVTIHMIEKKAQNAPA